MALAATAMFAPAQRVTSLGAAMTVDQSQTVTLSRNLHPQARAEFDQGEVDADTPLDRMILLLKPSPAQQSELDRLVAAQQNPASPLYHHWLTPAEYGARFGISRPDLARITSWLSSHGFTVDEIPSSGRLIVFSGAAAQVLDAFHTEIHRYKADGVTHLANSQDPQIPAPLRGVVDGVVSLHNFPRRSAIASRTRLPAPSATGARPLYSAGNTHYLFPADFAAIYNLNPLLNAGTAGAGISISIAGRSNINLGDVAAFRSLTGLAQETPSVVVAGMNPGMVPDDQDESTLDVEWAGAVAPAAAISLVAAKSTSTTDGVDLAAQYIVNQGTAQIVSVSYGSCEQDMGAAELAFYNSLWEQAAAQGMSVFVSSGDSGAAGCSAASSASGTQPAVNGLCTSPYSTCVGGTEFDEGANPARYWSPANSSSYGSALGYIPERVWNESAANGGLDLWASGGGPSAVYVQPDWQASVVGAGASNGMRAVPDVSLTSAGHDGYIIYENGSNWIIRGTSAAAPSFAGVVALVAEKMGGAAQGSVNAELYSLVNAERSPFHPTLSGNNTVPGVAGFWANGADFNLATGLGSVDGAALADNWGSAFADPPTLALAAASNPVQIAQGGSATVSFTAVTGGSFAGGINFSAAGLPSGITAAWLVNPIAPASNISTNSVTLALTASALAPLGSSTFAVSAAGNGLTSTQNVIVQVQPPRLCFVPFRTPRTSCNAPVPVRSQPHQLGR